MPGIDELIGSETLPHWACTHCKKRQIYPKEATGYAIFVLVLISVTLSKTCSGCCNQGTLLILWGSVCFADAGVVTSGCPYLHIPQGCECTSQPVASGFLCGIYGYGPPPGATNTGGNLSLPDTSSCGNTGYFNETNVFSFAFLSTAQTATLGNFTYPGVEDLVVSLQPQSPPSIFTATIENHSSVQQTQEREVTLRKTVSSSWKGSSSLQNSVVQKSSSSNSGDSPLCID